MSEPWLSGPLPDIDPLTAPLFYSFEQTRQELRAHTEGLTTAEVWARPHGLTPAGFHIRHIGGAVDRLGAYLRGDQLNDAQIAAMKAEPEPGEPPDELLKKMEEHLERCQQYVRTIDAATLREPREVGRKKLPTTVIGLIVHIAEHTQRHLGQAITTIKLVRAAGRQS
jgi:hypothetical protein